MSLDIELLMSACSACGRGNEVVAQQNYTHNVTPMWRLAGVYDALYMSDGKSARETLPALRAGVAAMASHPEAYRELNPCNGWGDSCSALDWLQRWTDACEQFPDAIIRVCK